MATQEEKADLQELQFYNSLTKRKEFFSEITGKKPGDTVYMYNCGPTVYGRAHIGNLSAYIMADLIRRVLESNGYKVIQAKNITDVGHLVDDSDDGEDKMELQAKKEKKDPLEIARFYERLYLTDEKKLRLKEPEFRPHATETIQEMIETIQKLFDNGYAYEMDDGVYFDVSKFDAYGALSGNTLDQIKAGARIEVNEHKKSPADFALWKKLIGVNKNHILNWDSPWGKGFPGWHIECSAMATKHLATVIDVHTGGEDNIFPHHECEIAQSCGASGEKVFSYFWIHKRHIQVDGEKMSKSKGNFYTLSDLEERGINPLDFKLLILMSHYRTRTNFTFNGINGAKKFREKFNNSYIKVNAAISEHDSVMSIKDSKTGKPVISEGMSGIGYVEYLKKMIIALNDDLNTPKFFALVHEFCDYVVSDIDSIIIRSKKELLEIKDIIEKVNSILDILDDEKLPEYIQDLLNLRLQARSNKDWKKSDEIRDELRNKGFSVEDGALGQIVKRID